MKIALVTAFPPSRKALAEYGFHLADELRQTEAVTLSILGDFLVDAQDELPGFRVIRCWGFDQTDNIFNLWRAIRRERPDIVWFNLGFASFGASPLPAMLSLATPAVARLSGVDTHVTLHQLFETVDLADAGVRRPCIYKAGGWLATHLLLGANSISVLLPAYRRLLRDRYKRGRVSSRSHGIFAGRPDPPDFSRRGNPKHRILAFGKWGTYKRLELLLEAFAQIADRVPDAELVVGGGDHPKTPGYIAETAARYASDRIRFLGYVDEEKIADVFQSASLAVMPYTSSAGSSGVAHLAAQYGLPIVASDIRDFKELAEHERIAIQFFATGNANDLARRLLELLESPGQLETMAKRNFVAALQMTMPEVVRQYVRSFRRNRRLKVLQDLARLRQSAGWFPGREAAAASCAAEVQSWDITRLQNTDSTAES